MVWIIRIFFSCFICINVVPSVLADVTNETTNIVGTSITRFSQSLNEQRKINVYLPDSYNDSNEEFPVLYVLDGQWHFLNAVAIQQSLKSPLAIPEMIVVGVINKNPERKTWFSSKSEKFRKYLTTELIPYIDGKYRTQKRKVLFGWEMGAFFSSGVLLENPELFEGIILSNGGAIEKKALEAYGREIQTDKYIYIANSDRDIYTIRFGDKLSKALAESTVKNLHWHYDKLNDETHQSTPYLALYKGLKYIFTNYAVPEFIDIDEFKSRGGMAYVTAYFEKRGQRFSFDQEIDDRTKNHLIWLSWKHNNFVEFDGFMEAFSEVLDTQRYQSEFWYSNFGEFYLKNGKLENAEDFFKRGVLNFTKSEKLHNGLGRVYKRRGVIAEARKHLGIAIELAIAHKNENMEKYKQDLKLLEQ